MANGYRDHHRSERALQYQVIRWVRRLWHAFGVDQCIFADTARIDYETLEHVVNIEQKYTRNDAKTGLSPVFEAVGASKRQNSRSLPMFRMPLVTGTVSHKPMGRPEAC
ncbi:unnamed protein product [Phytophthora fragariaefolia]|uniref:Unnamed protein product n=1 Tax=Phytophthora fragariaefolia TaxID=1490495 RepID=A0A9W7D910_9STRA|nr:unnamed protein product [Phytophthora fragariaefolia]